MWAQVLILDRRHRGLRGLLLVPLQAREQGLLLLERLNHEPVNDMLRDEAHDQDPGLVIQARNGHALLLLPAVLHLDHFKRRLAVRAAGAG